MPSAPSAPSLPDLSTPWLALLDRAREQAGDDPAARYVQLASVDADGSPRCRTVVAREVDAHTLRLVSDARADKVTQLAREPRAEVCWYLTEAREQFRLRGHARRLAPDDPAHLRLWLAQSPASRASYTWPAPGTPRLADDAFADSLPADAPPPATFAVIELRLTEVDWLSLRTHPHERRRFTLAGDTWQPTRLRP